MGARSTLTPIPGAQPRLLFYLCPSVSSVDVSWFFASLRLRVRPSRSPKRPLAHPALSPCPASILVRRWWQRGSMRPRLVSASRCEATWNSTFPGLLFGIRNGSILLLTTVKYPAILPDIRFLVDRSNGPPRWPGAFVGQHLQPRGYSARGWRCWPFSFSRAR